MQMLLYGLGYAVQLASVTGMAILPRLAPDFLSFLLIGAVLSSLVPASWLLLSATGGPWPRPRTGRLLILAGLLAGVAAIWDAHWFTVGWASGVVLVGLLLTVPPFSRRSRPRTGLRENGPVQAPVSRRGEI